MIKKITLLTVAISTGTALFAAPPRDDAKNQRPDDRRPNMVKPAPAKPQTAKPAPAKPAPIPIKPAPAKPLPPPAPYRQVRNTYTIQLNPDKTIIFEQRHVGLQELRDKINMVKYDHPRPIIRIKVVEGVDTTRLNFALDELKKAGFNDVEIIRLKHRTKFVPQPHHPAKRIKR